MTPALESLVGRRLTGVVPLGSRAIAFAFDGAPRAFLWVLLEPKRALVALADRMPISPDPRGTPFGGLERPLRGLRVRSVEAVTGAEGRLDFSLASPDAERQEETHRLHLAAEGPRIVLWLRQVADGTEGQVLFALDRKEGVGAAAGAGVGDVEAAEPQDATPAAAEAPPTPARPARPALLEIVAAGPAEVPDPLDALRARIERAFQAEFRVMVERLLRQAERALTRREAALARDKEAAEERVLDRRRGEILLTYYKEIQRGASRVELPDPYADSPGSRVRLVLDPALSPRDNATRLFQSAKKGERGLALVERRLAATRKSLAACSELGRAVHDLPPREAMASLDAFFQEAALDLSARGERRGRRSSRPSSAPPRAERPEHRSPGAHRSIRPRTFVTSDGWTVWVGRNNSDNDLLTHRLSQPHDFWLHVVGVPGSHVILRRPTRTAVPRPRTLEEAASIAAYFSKARKLSRVPVIYTERKFVSKPRRGKPGQALATRERELLVRPGLPKGGETGTDHEREVSS
jgi:predicted ribosome quality control (RQC) complex YloA/Tae2 family protein